MKIKLMEIAFMSICFVLFSLGTAIGAGGPGPADHCLDAVTAAEVTDDNPLLEGTFTAAHFVKDEQGNHRHFVRINLALERPSIFTELKDSQKHPKGKEVVIKKLFSMDLPAMEDNHLCLLTSSDILELFKLAPCMWEIGKAFGIAGTPVLTNIALKKKAASCEGGAGKGWISGAVKIRVVPDSSP